MTTTMVKVLLIALNLASRYNATEDFDHVNQFSMKIINAVYAFEHPEGLENFGVSTLPLWNVFAIISDGAAGMTFEEIVNGLNLPKDIRQTRKLMCYVRNIIKTKNNDATVFGKTAMFVKEGTRIHREFCMTAISNGNDIYTVNESNKTKLASEINEYICRVTQGYIRDAVNLDETDKVKFIIADAMYLKANWTYKFEVKDTKEMQFFNEMGKPIGYANMMFQKAPVEIGFIDSIEATTIEITFGHQKELSFLIILTMKNIGQILEQLSNIPTSDWINPNKTVEIKEIAIPKIRISSQLNLIKELKYLGVIKVFDRDKSDLPGISNEAIHVSNLIQKSVFELNEDGASVYTGTVKSRSLFEPVIVNSPFVYFVLERRTRLIIFGGVYKKPEVI